MSIKGSRAPLACVREGSSATRRHVSLLPDLALYCLIFCAMSLSVFPLP